MSQELKHNLRIKGGKMTPVLDFDHLRKALFLATPLFLISLFTGIYMQSLGFLCESLLIITLCWGIYRRNFSAILLLSVYLLIAKTYQLIFSTEIPFLLRLATLILALLFVRRFYLGSKHATKSEPQEKRIVGTFDAIFVLIISLASISISAFAINWYG